MEVAPPNDPELPRGLRIFLVEDELLIRLAMEEALKEFGCEVVASAVTLRDGLQMAEAVDVVDCAILDVVLGGDRVWALADELMSREVPIIFVTGHALNPEPHLASYLVLSKPISLTELKRGLAEACKRKDTAGI